MTLDDDMYLEILDRVNFRHCKQNMVKVLREWDAVRTSLNPRAKWYDYKPPAPTAIEINDIIAVLTDVAKDRYSLTSESYQDVLETLIEVENRVKNYYAGRNGQDLKPFCYCKHQSFCSKTHKDGGVELEWI